MRVATVAAAFLLASCAGLARVTSYGTELSDAYVRVGGYGFSVYFHPTDPTLLVQQRLAEQVPADSDLPWRDAAQRVLQEAGPCEVRSVTKLGPGSYEAAYTCANGGRVPNAVVETNRDRWRLGIAGPPR